MPKISAGILPYRYRVIPDMIGDPEKSHIEFFLCHPSGPFFSKKDDGIWSIPKGEIEAGEDAWTAAKREFKEEVGVGADRCVCPNSQAIELSPIKTPSKTYLAWGVEMDIDPTFCKSNFFEMEWPPKSGNYQNFPELDKYAWLDMPSALQKISPNQTPFIQELITKALSS